MTINFRSLVLASIAIAATAIATVPAQAATTGATIVTVPFNFTVGNQSLPAGDYSFQRDGNGSFVRMEGKDPSQSFHWVALANDSDSDRVVLKFDVRGQSHELHSVQYRAVTTPRLDRKGNAREREEQVVSGQ